MDTQMGRVQTLQAPPSFAQAPCQEQGPPCEVWPSVLPWVEALPAGDGGAALCPQAGSRWLRVAASSAPVPGGCSSLKEGPAPGSLQRLTRTVVWSTCSSGELQLSPCCMPGCRRDVVLRVGSCGRGRGGSWGGRPSQMGRELSQCREAQALFAVIWCVTFPEEGPQSDRISSCRGHGCTQRSRARQGLHKVPVGPLVHLMLFSRSHLDICSGQGVVPSVPDCVPAQSWASGHHTVPGDATHRTLRCP